MVATGQQSSSFTWVGSFLVVTPPFQSVILLQKICSIQNIVMVDVIAGEESK
jgi:hypothetical protein